LQEDMQVYDPHNLYNPLAYRGHLEQYLMFQGALLGGFPRPFSYPQRLEKHCKGLASSQMIAVAEMHVVSWGTAMSNFKKWTTKVLTSKIEQNSSSASHSNSMSLYFTNSFIPSLSRNLLIP
jgi:hypothetical protein